MPLSANKNTKINNWILGLVCLSCALSLSNAVIFYVFDKLSEDSAQHKAIENEKTKDQRGYVGFKYNNEDVSQWKLTGRHSVSRKLENEEMDNFVLPEEMVPEFGFETFNFVDASREVTIKDYKHGITAKTPKKQTYAGTEKGRYAGDDWDEAREIISILSMRKAEKEIKPQQAQLSN